MDKSKFIELIVASLERDFAALKAAATETYAAATGDESKPENKYDTRALEASYLAGAQAKRAHEVEISLGIFKTLRPKKFAPNSRIESTALVELDLNGKTVYVFIAPARGSLTVSYDSKSIKVITPQSPLGEALLGSSRLMVEH